MKKTSSVPSWTYLWAFVLGYYTCLCHPKKTRLDMFFLISHESRSSPREKNPWDFHSFLHIWQPRTSPWSHGQFYQCLDGTSDDFPWPFFNGSWIARGYHPIVSLVVGYHPIDSGWWVKILLWMEGILHQLIDGLSHDLYGFQPSVRWFIGFRRPIHAIHSSFWCLSPQQPPWHSSDLPNKWPRQALRLVDAQEANLA
jgi:hypothetical protein